MSLRRRRRSEDAATAAALRAALHARARRAPRGDELTERILAAVDEPDTSSADWSRVPRRRPARGWMLPAVAAASVAAVAAAAVGITALTDGAPPAPSGHRHDALPTGSVLPSRHHSRPNRFSSHVVPPATSSAPRGTGGLRDVRVLDLSFAGTDDGWALASARCVTGPGRCTALLRTHDGTTWNPMPGAAFNVAGVDNCSYPCVTDIRFATDRIGYAFGPDALLMTYDGGRNWQRQPGGALALETLAGNVIRVTSTSPSGCPGPCGVGVETAQVGSTAWTRTAAAGQLRAASAVAAVRFARSTTDAYLLLQGNPAGGAVATSTLYRSTDAGRTWSSAGEPCPQGRGENDSAAIAAGGAGDVAVLCNLRAHPSRSEVITSTDAAASFRTAPGTVPFRFASLLSGDPATVLVAAGPAPWARSTDGGRSWHLIAGVPGPITFVGFESSTVGRVIAGGGTSIWTTRDAGRSWQPAQLG